MWVRRRGAGVVPPSADPKAERQTRCCLGGASRTQAQSLAGAQTGNRSDCPSGGLQGQVSPSPPPPGALGPARGVAQLRVRVQPPGEAGEAWRSPAQCLHGGSGPGPGDVVPTAQAPSRNPRPVGSGLCAARAEKPCPGQHRGAWLEEAEVGRAVASVPGRFGTLVLLGG